MEADRLEDAPEANEQTPLLRQRQQQRRKEGRKRSWYCSIRLFIPALAISLLALVTLVLLSSLIPRSSFISGVWTSVSHIPSRGTCFALLVSLKQLIILGNGPIISIFTSACIALNIQSADVCRGAIERQAPVVAYALRSIRPNKYAASALCNHVFGLCTQTGSVQSWPEDVFPRPNITRTPPQRSGRRKKVVHISDIHMDSLYVAGSEAACGKVMCCRQDPSSPTTSHSIIKSPAGLVRFPLGFW